MEKHIHPAVSEDILKQFKDVTGMTLRQYRELYGAKNFRS